ncbi:MAG: HAMP domain-containing histidine kinase [Spirochaetaceae bacterium]|jgi:two-component system sensor histidine kinase HydH|nr:HAMP domain-containing histidine kinase [Spirochaetaceae bacterium]
MKFPVKFPPKTASLIAALAIWLLLSVLTAFIFWELRDRARFIRDNQNERLFNVLFTSLRDYEDFGSAIESSPLLRNRIAGFGIFGDDLKQVYGWGAVPPVLDEEPLKSRWEAGPGRYAIPDKQGSRVKFILHTRPGIIPPRQTAGERRYEQTHEWEQTRRGRLRRYRYLKEEPGGGPQEAVPLPPERPAPLAERPFSPGGPIPFPPGGAIPFPEGQQPPGGLPPAYAFFSTLAGSKYLYIDVIHPAYWRTLTVTTVFFPFCEAVLLGVVFFVRRLYLKNREYRERIESQKNLVVLGTAASTLAHEIKNPLLSIRLQTGILRKLFAGAGTEELTAIDDEVERLSAMTYRVNDFLRDAVGNPAALNSYAVLRAVSLRLCGRDIVEDGAVKDGMILMDNERACSVFENLIRNALESGGPKSEVRASIGRSGGHGPRRLERLVITITDRGGGIAPGDSGRVFDPFFTKKSTGTGIGLSISKRFIEAAGGTIILENREGGGAAVRLTLPEYRKEESCGY